MKKLAALLLAIVLLFSCADIALAKAKKKAKYKPSKISAAAKKKAKAKKNKKAKKAPPKFVRVRDKYPVQSAATELPPAEAPVTPVTPSSTLQPPPPAAAQAAVKPVSTYNYRISPKVGLMGGLNSSFGFGCEFGMPIMPSVDAMGEVWLIPGSGWSIMGFAGNGIYKFEQVPGMPASFYAGGGVLYDIVSISTWGGASGSSSILGFQGIAGFDYPMEGVGVLFGQAKYILASLSYTVNILGIPTSFSTSAGGFGLEGGYRFSF